MPAPAEDLPVTQRNDVYSAIDPASHFEKKTYAGKSVLITGASRGIGLEIALFYAKAGADVALVARDQSALDSAKAIILAAAPTSRVITAVADVTNSQSVKELVELTVKELGKIDITVANAGKIDPWDKPFTQGDPGNWWQTISVNVQGVYNLAHYTLPELVKTKGYYVTIGSAAGQVRIPFGSAYGISKHTVNRLSEYIALEYPDVKAFVVHPGAIPTEMAKYNPQYSFLITDTLQLPAATLLRLTSGRDDYLSGRYVSATWDLDEVERDFKEKIIEQDSLVNRLHVPQ